jgi:hypothetical protein
MFKIYAGSAGTAAHVCSTDPGVVGDVATAPGSTHYTTAAITGRMKRIIFMDITQIISLAKRGQISKSDLFSRMQSYAEAQRGPGESTAQAFVKFINTDEGSELFRLQKAMSGSDVTPQNNPTVKSRIGTGGGEWGTLIAAMKRGNPGVPEHRLINEALSTPEGLRLFQMTKRSQQISGDTGFTKADMQVLDDIAAEQRTWTDMRKGSPGAADVHAPSSYNDLLDKARSMYPTMSESKLHDFVRARNPDAWADHKLQKLGSGGNLPQHRHQYQQAGDEHVTAATSMRTPPGRAPQWQSDHSSSTPTTPARTPQRMDDTPTVKSLDRIAKHAGMTRYELTKNLLAIPAGEVAAKWITEAAMESGQRRY